uniref:Thioredoxin domain-containing protein n=1 Tax=viral metagenome TaxID=1070528 RepID=A0A6C0HS24_9ZZZZ
MKKVITNFETRQDFLNLLPKNPGLIIIKFGAPWCKPCQKIAHIVDGFFATSPESVICADINIDENFDLYAFMKKMGMVNGIPAILMYKQNNLSYISDDSVSGADPKDLDGFFKRCGNALAAIERQNKIK